ncbi:hypothetical protein ACIP68_15390 [Streptomyces griseoviridis]
MFASVSVMTGALLLVSAPSASAAGSGCQVDGAVGSWSGSWASSTRIDPLSLYVADVSADGHHPAVRLITRNNAGAIKSWSWHHIYGGNGDAKVWNTFASDSNGIAAATVEVAVFEGDDWLVADYCSWIYR